VSDNERTPYPKYQECPCGSGQKYKFCCYTKGFHYYLGDDGTVARSVPISKDLREALETHKAIQEKKLGRPVQPGDKLFPGGDEKKLKASMADLMRETGVRPVLIYAFEKTGLMVTEQNKHLMPDADLAEWDAACEEYYRLHPEDDPRTT
jgi:hypothetical protein